MNKKFILNVLFLILLLLSLFFLALAIGIYNLSIFDIITLFWNKFINTYNEDTAYLILFKIRFPRTLLAALIGASLATSGLTFQTVLRNPLADPYLLGISSGSAFGVIVFTISGLTHNPWLLPIAALLGGMLSVIIVFYLIPSLLFKQRVSLTSDMFILSGVITSYLFSSLIIFIICFSSNYQLQKILYWLLGDISQANSTHSIIIAPYFIFVLIFLLYKAKALNLILVGDESAQTLGINPFKVKRNCLLTASLLTAASVSVSGPIGFVGLIVPHLCKKLYGFDHRKNFIFVPLCGAIFLTSVDMLARFLSHNLEVPIGAVTTLIGAPLFLLILLRLKGNR